MKKMLKPLLVLLVLGALFLLVIPTAVTMVVTVVLGGEEEEENVSDDEGWFMTTLLSDEVESYRDKVYAAAKELGMEAYIDLFLAVMMQESGGEGNDVFQASESKGLPPNTLTVDESIKQGVAYLTSMLKKATCTSPSDLSQVKLALQGYNMSGGYIDYALEESGRWTQENVLAYAKKKSGGKKRTGAAKESLGPWAYGDQYYVAHVLRYYDTSGTNLEDVSGATAIRLEDRLNWLFPNGVPKNQFDMSLHMTTISVPIYTTKKKKSTMSLTVHKKLAGEIKKAFEEMQKAKFPIDPSDTACYCYRVMASGTGSLSHHSYGCAVDINASHNGAAYTSWPYKPGKDKLAVTQKIVKIWEKHGFYWGGNWSAAYQDPMHFSYTNH